MIHRFLLNHSFSSHQAAVIRAVPREISGHPDICNGRDGRRVTRWAWRAGETCCSRS
jgi:hypothetical protein